MPEADAEGDTPWAVGPLAAIECTRLNIELHLNPNGSHTGYVSRLPPPRRPFNFQKPPRNRCVWRRVRRGGGGGAPARGRNQPGGRKKKNTPPGAGGGGL